MNYNLMDEKEKINEHSFFGNLDKPKRIEDSLFKCIDAKIVPEANVGNFSLNDKAQVAFSPESAFRMQSGPFINAEGSFSKLNHPEVLFSGYFGPKKFDDKTPSCSTNPFSEEENNGGFDRQIKNSSRAFNEGFNTGFNTLLNISKFSNCSSKMTNTFSFDNLVKSVSLDKSKKQKSSEEILLEKIEKEKEEIRRLKQQNTLTAEKCKHFNQKPIVPSPLTLIKPFNFSSSKLLTKKRTGDQLDTEKINNKIKDTIKKKIEAFGGGMKENVYGNDKISLSKSPSNVRLMKKSTGARSKSPCQDVSEELMSLSNRIEKYCVISNKSVSLKDKSPTRLCLNEDSRNSLTECNQPPMMSSSIRKQFSFETSTEDKIVKEMELYKFKAKPLNKNIFKKQTVVESFDSILMKTRKEKEEMDKQLKDNKKNQKMNQIKQSQAKRNIFKNENMNSMNRNDLMLIE